MDDPPNDPKLLPAGFKFTNVLRHSPKKRIMNTSKDGIDMGTQLRRGGGRMFDEADGEIRDEAKSPPVHNIR